MNSMTHAEQKTTAVADFGKDHWSLLGYIEGRCVDHSGRLDNAQMRDKRKTGWDKDAHGTILFGYWTEGKGGLVRHPDRRLSDHDDYDCLADLEAGGFCRNMGKTMQPTMTMTDLGYQTLTAVKKHKEKGGTFSNFKI